MKKILNISGKIVLAFIALLLLLWLLLQLPIFQTWLTKRVANQLGNSLHTRISVGHVNISWLNKLNIEEVMMEDQHQDTLLSVGLLQVKITDWFFLKDSADIKYVRLDNVNARLFRHSDSVWNYKFLIDFFGGSNSKKEGGKGIALHLKEVELHNIKFQEIDEWRGKTIIGSLGSLHLKAKQIDFNKNIYDINSLTIDKPEYREINKSGAWRKIDSISFRRTRQLEKAADTLPKKISANKLFLKINNLEISKGTFQFYNRHKQPSREAEFDEKDILITHLYVKTDALSFIGDTMRANIKQLQANERSGLKIKNLTTLLTANPKMIELAKLDLQLNESHLSNYYAMHFNELDDMEDFLDSVKITAHLKNSIINIPDIGFFAPELKNIHQKAIITGNINKQTISNFIVNDLNLNVGKSRMTGVFSMIGLPDINTTLISFTTPGTALSLDDIIPWSPGLTELKKTPINNLGIINFAGNFGGTIYNFVTNGLLKTNVGSLTADFKLNMNEPGKGYSGKISNAVLDGGKLLDVPKLGYITFNGNFSSNGFAASSPIEIKGDIAQAKYANYTYEHISVNSQYQNNKFTALLGVDDKNLSGKFETKLDFNVKKQHYNGKGILTHANPHALGFIKDSLLFSGEFDVDFQGKNIDDFLGYARFYNTEIYSSQGKLNCDSLVLSSSIDSLQNKILSLHTNEADAFITGKFNLLSLPASFQYFLNSYYPAIIEAPKKVPMAQNIEFNIATRNISTFLDFFDKKLTGLENASINGSLNTDSSILYVNADLPLINYGNLSLFNVGLKGSGTGEMLNMQCSVDNVQINDSLNLPNILLKLQTNKDTSYVEMTTGSNGPWGDAQLNAHVFSGKEGFETIFNESSFFINNKKWTIHEKANIVVTNGYLTSNGFTLNQEDQK